MKKYIIASIAALILSVDGFSCAFEEIHNWYLFRAFPMEREQNLFLPRINSNWRAYIGDNDVSDWALYDRARETAESRGDEDMTAYLDMLDQYVEISRNMQDTWEYPTKEELAERKEILQGMVARCSAYNGRLRSQYTLMLMRANMILGNHSANKDLWERKSSGLIDSVYKEMMENIYAGALIHLGETEKANEIFLRQGDLISLKWSVREFHNLAGIKSVYSKSPDSPALPYLIQVFVNNFQETQDAFKSAAETDYELDPSGDGHEWMVLQKDMQEFLVLADQVLAEGKTSSPCLWKTASGALLCLSGDYRKAVAELTAAESLKGTRAEKNNARAIRLYAASHYASDAEVLSALKWFDAMSKYKDGDHLLNIKDKTVYISLYPRYTEEGRHNLAVALVGMQEGIGNNDSDYWSNAFRALDELGADRMAEYSSWSHALGYSPLEAYAIEKGCVRNKNYFDDLIGTKYIAEGRFEEAIPYLKKTSLDFLGSQGISPYAKARDYTRPRWFGKRQAVRNEYEPVSVDNNKKLRFCQDMVSLLKKYDSASGEEANALAYELAVRYYQASYEGDCWYLTHYGWSSSDSVREGEMDFISKADGMLEKSASSSEINLRRNSLYALAYICANRSPWVSYEYHWAEGSGGYIKKPDVNSIQYKRLSVLEDFLKANPDQRKDDYISRCDVLNDFRLLVK